MTLLHSNHKKKESLFLLFTHLLFLLWTLKAYAGDNDETGWNKTNEGYVNCIILDNDPEHIYILEDPQTPLQLYGSYAIHGSDFVTRQLNNHLGNFAQFTCNANLPFTINDGFFQVKKNNKKIKFERHSLRIYLKSIDLKTKIVSTFLLDQANKRQQYLTAQLTDTQKKAEGYRSQFEQTISELQSENKSLKIAKDKIVNDSTQQLQCKQQELEAIAEIEKEHRKRLAQEATDKYSWQIRAQTITEENEQLKAKNDTLHATQTAATAYHKKLLQRLQDVEKQLDSHSQQITQLTTTTEQEPFLLLSTASTAPSNQSFSDTLKIDPLSAPHHNPDQPSYQPHQPHQPHQQYDPEEKNSPTSFQPKEHKKTRKQTKAQKTEQDSFGKRPKNKPYIIVKNHRKKSHRADQATKTEIDELTNFINSDARSETSENHGHQLLALLSSHINATSHGSKTLTKYARKAGIQIVRPLCWLLNYLSTSPYLMQTALSSLFSTAVSKAVVSLFLQPRQNPFIMINSHVVALLSTVGFQGLSGHFFNTSLSSKKTLSFLVSYAITSLAVIYTHTEDISIQEEIANIFNNYILIFEKMAAGLTGSGYFTLFIFLCSTAQISKTQKALAARQQQALPHKRLNTKQAHTGERSNTIFASKTEAAMYLGMTWVFTALIMTIVNLLIATG